MDKAFVSLDIVKLIIRQYCKDDFQLENSICLTCRKLRHYHKELNDDRFKDFLTHKPIYIRLCLYQLKDYIKIIDYNLLELVTTFICECESTMASLQYRYENHTFQEFICVFLFKYCYINNITNFDGLYYSDLLLTDIPFNEKLSQIRNDFYLISSQVENVSCGQILREYIKNGDDIVNTIMSLTKD